MATQGTKTNHNRTYDKYLRAMVNLYGHLTVQEAFDILNDLEDGKYHLEDFVQFVEQRYKHRDNASERKRNYRVFTHSEVVGSACIKENPVFMHIIHEAYTSNMDKYYGSWRNQFPLYCVEKSELLALTNQRYYLKPSMENLASVIRDYMRPGYELLSDKVLLDPIILPIIEQADFPNAFKALLMFVEIPKERRDQTAMLNELVGFLYTVYSDVPSWEFRGNTLIGMEDSIWEMLIRPIPELSTKNRSLS